MLAEVHVRDLALIEDVWLELGPGLNAITGETGAGKTVLVGALKLLVGERADSALVRTGADEALVEGRFEAEGEESFARRRVTAEGRSKCYIDGQMAAVKELASSFGPLVDLHGQHEHQALLKPAAHAGYLDRYVGEPANDALREYRVAFDASAESRGERERLAEALADRVARGELLRFQVEEIDACGPSADEDSELEARLPRMRHGERLALAASTAFGALNSDTAATDRLAEALSALEGVEGIDPELDGVIEDVRGVLAETDDAAGRLRDYGERVEYDPAALNETEARLASLGSLKRKYGPGLSDVLAHREAAAAELELLDSGEERLKEAAAREEAAAAELRVRGETLLAVRTEAASSFVRELGSVAAELEMGAALFEVALEELPFDSWSASGPCRVEFLFTSSEGDPPKPLARVASGGEVSRVMLALKSVLGRADVTSVLVFDEIDAGVGGATAVAVGRRLAELARSHQVVVVTHLAQVAAFADRHVVVEKDESSGRSVTSAREVEGDERTGELARMLSGSDTETGLAHARELLASTRSAPA